MCYFSQFFKCVIPVDKWVLKRVPGITLKYSWQIAYLIKFYNFLVPQHKGSAFIVPISFVT